MTKFHTATAVWIEGLKISTQNNNNIIMMMMITINFVSEFTEKAKTQNTFKDEAQTALFKAPVRTAL